MKDLKLIEASQAKLVNRYINTKRKLLTTNAHIWFNRTCQNKNITPRYANLKLKGSNNATKLTQKQLIKIRINNELKFLYIKKQNINNQLYKSHLENAQYWQTSWPLIENNINQKLNEESKKHYEKLNNKINKLKSQLNENIQPKNKQTFYPRLHNMTKIQFTENETNLLNKGTKFNIGIPPKNHIKQLIYETENAIRQVTDNTQQEAIRYLATKNIQQILKNKTTNKEYKQHIHTTKQIKQKLIQNKATIAEADKGKTLVILYKDDLNKRVKHFIDNNNIMEINKDPTLKFQKAVQNALKQCKTIINSTTKKQVQQMNPKAPNMNAKIKIHKQEAPIRPVINNTNAPTHKLAKYIHQTLKNVLNLKYEYNITNTAHFAENISNLKLNTTHKIITMDIKDLYVNIPTNETLNIAKNLLILNHTERNTKNEIILILKTILDQNYFQYNDKFYKPRSGIAMGSPLSGIMAEIFLQHFEQCKIKHLLEDKNIVYYNRYVDDIIMIYNQTKITPQHILKQFNEQNKNLQFTLNEETNKQITYLDLKLTNDNGRIHMEIYRKPTSTDITINNTSCHPQEHKLAAYRSWIHRLLTLKLEDTAKNKELNTIIEIAQNNGYRKDEITRIHKKLKQKINNPNTNEKKEQKWITYTYTGNYIRKITKLFRNTNIKIAYKTNHTLGKLVHERKNIDPYEQSGIYKLTCQSCQKVYIGQTGRKLSTRYTEHIRNIRLNKDESAFAQHILNTRHQYGPITTIMEILETAKKGNLMNIKEDFQIYYHNKHKKLIEEQRQIKETNNQKNLFELIIQDSYTPTLTSQTQDT